jgi:outer membrane protein
LSLAALAPAPCAAETLFDAMLLAYRSNPSLAAEQARLQSTNESYVQSRAGYGPQASVNGQVDYQAARVQQPPSFFTPKSTTDYLAGNASADLSITQPLFTNGQVTAQVRAAASDVRAERQNLRQLEGQLLSAVVSAYMDVRRDREIIAILNDEVANLTSVVAEQEAKGRLGTVSKVDVAQSEARLLATQAELSQARGRLETSNAEFVNIVGETPIELEAPPELPNLPPSVDAAFMTAEKGNAQLTAALESEQAARQRVNQAKGANGPTLALKVDAAIIPTEPFIPNQYDKSVTAALVFSQPLFTSGLNASRVRQAADEDARAALQVEITRRDVVQQVSQAWSTLTSAQAAQALQERQVTAEQVAAEGNRIEERAGLRTTIDLLNAIAELAGNQQNLAAAKHDVYVAKAQLLAAMGLLEVKYVLPGASTYDPVKPLKAVIGINAPPWEGAVSAIDAAAPVRTAPPAVAKPPVAGVATIPGAGDPGH